MKSGIKLIGQRLLPLLLPIVLGTGIFAGMKLLQPGPEVKDITEDRRPLRTLRLETMAVIPRVRGYGTAYPDRIWEAVARVRGNIVEIASALHSGAFVEQGTLLLRIDPAEYQLAVEKSRTAIDKTRAALEELQSRKTNENSLLKIEEDTLQVVRREYERNERLREKDAVADAAVDAARRELLGQQHKVQVLKNSLALIPSQRKALEAELAALRTDLKSARLNLDYTEIKAPFDARIAEVSLQEQQFVTTGMRLFKAYGTAVSKVEAQLTFSEFQKLLSARELELLKKSLISGEKTNEKLTDLITVEVRQSSGPIRWQWPARLIGPREIVDAATRTYGLIVAVDDPYGTSSPGKRPPLLKGAFCEVQFSGPVRTGQIVIPAGAVRNDTVYILDAENRLQRRPIKIAFRQEDLLVVASGLHEDETIVTSYPQPAFQGMLVEPVPDRDTQAKLKHLAAGREPFR